MTEERHDDEPLLQAAEYLAKIMPLQMGCVRSMARLRSLLLEDESFLGWSEEHLAALDRLTTEVSRLGKRWLAVVPPGSFVGAHRAFARACASFLEVLLLLHQAVDRQDQAILGLARTRLRTELVVEFRVAQEEQARTLGGIDGGSA
jgi:hypothetical protein